MRHYEIMLLVHPDHANQVPPIIERYKQLVENAQGTVHRSERVEGTVHRLEQFKRRLAYPLKKLNKGYYVLMNIECDASTQQEIQKSADFNDLIIRCLSIQRKTAITAPSLLSDRPAGAATDSGQTPEIKREPRKSKYRPAIDLAEADIDYKNVELLNHCLTDTKKIPRRRTTGATAKQQRLLRQACKRARFVGLLPHCDKYDQPEIN